jgi:hypothetical protein
LCLLSFICLVLSGWDLSTKLLVSFHWRCWTLLSGAQSREEAKHQAWYAKRIKSVKGRTEVDSQRRNLRWNTLKGAITRGRFIFDSIKFLKIAKRLYEYYEASECSEGRHVFLLEAVSTLRKSLKSVMSLSFPSDFENICNWFFFPQPNKIIIVFVLRSIHHLVNSSRNSALAAILVI